MANGISSVVSSYGATYPVHLRYLKIHELPIVFSSNATLLAFLV